MSNIKKDSLITEFKAWLTPILISILGIMLWSQLSELKEDVKKLLAYQASNDVKVSMLEKEVDILRQKYDGQTIYSSRENDFPKQRFAKKEEGPKVPTPKETPL
jgi:hypothetical protein